MNANRYINYLPQIVISYSGFEEAMQEEMDKIVKANKKIFEEFLALPNFRSAGNEEPINIHIVYMNGTCHFNYRTRQTNNLSVLCVSDFSSLEKVIECIRIGFGGCVSYSNLFRELVPAIISIFQNKIYVSPCLLPVLYDDLKVNDAGTQPYNQLFTQREKNLIQLLTTGALYKEIASQLEISENTVRSHIRHIYSKLKVHSKTELTVKIMNSKIISSLIYFITACMRALFDDVAYLCY